MAEQRIECKCGEVTTYPVGFYREGWTSGPGGWACLPCSTEFNKQPLEVRKAAFTQERR